MQVQEFLSQLRCLCFQFTSPNRMRNSVSFTTIDLGSWGFQPFYRQWYFIIVFICIFLLTNNMEHLLPSWFTTSICLLGEVFGSFSHLKIGLFIFLLLSFKNSLNILYMNPSSDGKNVLPFFGSTSHSIDTVFHGAGAFNGSTTQLLRVFLHGLFF